MEKGFYEGEARDYWLEQLRNRMLDGFPPGMAVDETLDNFRFRDSGFEKTMRDGGDTYRGMPFNDFLKIAEREGFEQTFEATFEGRRTAGFGRRADAVLTSVSVIAGMIAGATGEFSTDSPETFRPYDIIHFHGRAPGGPGRVRFRPINGLRLKLRYFHENVKFHGLWCSEDVVPNSGPLHRTCITQFETDSLDKKRADRDRLLTEENERRLDMMSPEWQDIVDRAGKRTLDEAIGIRTAPFNAP